MVVQKEECRNTETHKDAHKMCIVTRQLFARHDVFRFVISPDNQLVFDLEENLPGRGYWVSAHKEIVEKAIQTKAFERVSKEKLSYEYASSDFIVEKIRNKIMSLFGFAQKKGDVIHGYEKIDMYCRQLHGKKGSLEDFIFIARDAGSDALKMKAKAGSLSIHSCQEFYAAELSKAIGKENCVYAYVKESGLTKKIAHYLEKMEKYMGVKKNAENENKDCENSSFVVKQ